MTECYNTDHFRVDAAGRLTPQPWMQYRHLGGVEAASKSAAFKTAGGGNKNELIHNLRQSFTNDSPLPQLVYGMVTRGGAQVTLQARSRGYLWVASGYAIGNDPGPLAECSRLGVGADAGKAGTLSIGTGFCVVEARQNSVTFPLAPERTGWQQVNPGQKITAGVQVRFISDFWETTSVDGGDTGTESFYVSGGTRLDLFAVPLIDV